MASEPEPWYRTSAAVFASGGVGVALVIALVITVVQMSDQWSVPASTVGPPPPPATTAGSTTAVTTTMTSTTYTSTVQLSTTDINAPSAPPPGSETSSSEPTSTREETDEDEPPTRTTRRGPRFNETRTLFPRPGN